MSTADSRSSSVFFSVRDAKRLVADAHGRYRDAQDLSEIPDRLLNELRQLYGRLRDELVSQRLSVMPVSDLPRFFSA